MLTRVLHYASVLGSIPNAPFLHGRMLKEILSFLGELGITEIAETTSLAQGSYAVDEYCLYVRFKRGRPSWPVLIDSHIDHPAFVLNGRGQGIAFGSVGFERIHDLLSRGSIDLRVFDQFGDFVTMGKLTEFQFAAKPVAQIKTSVQVPTNSHGLWNVTDFEVNGTEVDMHCADNMIVTCVMLALIEQVVLRPAEFPDLDVTFVFSFLEEVFEASASALASRRQTPFDAIDDRWIIIVLECMQSAPLPSQNSLIAWQGAVNGDLRNQRLIDDNEAYSRNAQSDYQERRGVHHLYETLGLPLPNHDDGVLIKINDTDCVYGFEFINQVNLAETLMLSVADELRIRYQHTLSGGACNGTAFSLFPVTSNVVTLSVPNPYKHNIYLDGRIVPERIRVGDISAVSDIMLKILKSMKETVAQDHDRALAMRLKQSSLTPSPSVARKLRLERSTIAWSVQPRLRRMGYFPQNLRDNMIYSTRSVRARANELASRTVSGKKSK